MRVKYNGQEINTQAKTIRELIKFEFEKIFGKIFAKFNGELGFESPA